MFVKLTLRIPTQMQLGKGETHIWMEFCAIRPKKAKFRLNGFRFRKLQMGNRLQNDDNAPVVVSLVADHLVKETHLLAACATTPV